MAVVLTNENFEEEVLKSEVPVLVDLYADWCGPCKAMGPIVEELANEYQGKVKVGKLNVDDNSEIASQYGVMSIPTFLMMKDGVVKEKLAGMRDKKDLVETIEKTI